MRAIYPGRDARRDRGGADRVARRAGPGAHRDARSSPSTACRKRCSTRPTCCSGGGTSPTTRCPTRSSRASTPRCWTGWACSSCTPPTTRRSSRRCSARRAICAGATRASASWSGPSTPSHPIAAGVPNPIVIDAQEMYGEPFAIPRPEELVFISSFAGGEVFRGGCTWVRGAGRIFYFSPGDRSTRLSPCRRQARARERRRVGDAAAARRPPAARSRRWGGGSEERRRRRGRLGRPAAHQGVRGDGGRGAHRHRRARGGGPRRARRGVRRAARVARWEDLLEVEGLEAISIAVPTFLHAPIAVAALSRGLHVLSEKPIALNGEQAEAMVDGGAERRPGAPGRVQPPPPRRRQAAPRADRGGAARAALLREGVVAAAHRHPDARRRGSRSPSWPAAGRWWTSACTCSTTRSSCSATPR